MKPVQFKRFSFLEAQAITGLENAKYIAGGQSLGPMLNLRLARPDVVVDVLGLHDLHRIEEDKNGISYGAATRHVEFEDDLVPDATGGMLSHVAAGIAYRAIRNRGTLGGSLAHADPAADWVNVMIALDAELRITGPAGKRSIPCSNFMQAAFMTALQPGEIIQSVWVPRLSKNARWGYYKFCRKVGEFSEATGTVVVDPERGYARIVLGALDGAPILLEVLADTLAEKGIDAAIADVESAVTPLVEGMPNYRQQHYKVSVCRALEQLKGTV